MSSPIDVALSFNVQPGKEAAAQASLTRALKEPLNLSLPAKKGHPVSSVAIDLASVVSVAAGAGTIEVASDTEAFDRAAYAWLQALSKLPPKNLPRAQRMGVGLLHKIPEHSTGNTFIDYGRRRVFDQTRGSLLQFFNMEITRRATAVLGNA